MLESLDGDQARARVLTLNLLDAIQRVHDRNRGNLPLLERYTAHLGILALTILTLLLGSLHFEAVSIPGIEGETYLLPPIQLTNPNDLNDLTQAVEPFTSQPPPAPISAPGGPPLGTRPLGSNGSSAPPGAPPRNRTEIYQYTVGQGDTLSRIAASFGLSADALLWANDKLQDNPDQLSLGQVLNIPPANGVLVTVGQGDTVDLLARRYHAKPEEIANFDYNQSHHTLRDGQLILIVGQLLMIPGGTKPFQAKPAPVIIPPRVVAPPVGVARGTGNFSWPTAACVYQYFWARHSGIDLATPTGTPVVAADAGFVQQVGWDSTGYGYQILIDHGNGFITRYAHLSAWFVSAGQSVKKGELIARVGSTGNSTGPHLHFEVILQGVARNPTSFISGIPGSCFR